MSEQCASAAGCRRCRRSQRPGPPQRPTHITSTRQLLQQQRQQAAAVTAAGALHHTQPQVGGSASADAGLVRPLCPAAGAGSGQDALPSTPHCPLGPMEHISSASSGCGLRPSGPCGAPPPLLAAGDGCARGSGARPERVASCRIAIAPRMAVLLSLGNALLGAARALDRSASGAGTQFRWRVEPAARQQPPPALAAAVGSPPALPAARRSVTRPCTQACSAFWLPGRRIQSSADRSRRGEGHAARLSLEPLPIACRKPPGA